MFLNIIYKHIQKLVVLKLNAGGKPKYRAKV